MLLTHKPPANIGDAALTGLVVPDKYLRVTYAKTTTYFLVLDKEKRQFTTRINAGGELPKCYGREASGNGISIRGGHHVFSILLILG